MKSSFRRTICHSRGLTLLELTVVICVIMTLLTILFIGARSWKRGSDRAGCILIARNVQWAMRSYQNLGGYDPGSHLNAYEESQDMLELLNAKGFFSTDIYQTAKGQKPCPGGGTCSTAVTAIFPPIGDLLMTCSLAGDQLHVPVNHDEW